MHQSYLSVHSFAAMEGNTLNIGNIVRLQPPTQSAKKNHADYEHLGIVCANEDMGGFEVLVTRDGLGKDHRIVLCSGAKVVR
jgi:hypothetical protein